VIPVLCRLFLPDLKGTPIGDVHVRDAHVEVESSLGD
jgi:hypothetical protein